MLFERLSERPLVTSTLLDYSLLKLQRNKVTVMCRLGWVKDTLAVLEHTQNITLVIGPD